MAEIPLRSYLHDIEKHIESGRTDQAIAHCRYILQSYPKYVDAYRLLGKAYLESQRYGDAGDIFQRVLSSVPDDFVSHVGMSIIREDEGNLDEAIWHMERGFEVQPSNNAIQEELRRLYGKRDHVEPPKIRLTRGALARMYYKGELYQQAIGEIRAMLADSPDRLDLQALLADIYLKINQRVDAADTALAVLQRLPNCLVANRVMIQVLAGTEREMEQKSYRQRLAQLDPYSVFAAIDAPSSDAVSEHAIKLEKLDWKPDTSLTGEAGQPAWAASLGVDLGDLSPAKEETLPDWLSGISTEPGAPKEAEAIHSSAFTFDEAGPSPAGEESPLPGASEEEIPDWLRHAGWGPSSGAGEQAEAQLATGQPGEEKLPETGPLGSIPLAETDADAALGDDQIAEAQLPDWLKAMAPPPRSAEQAPEPAEKEEEEDVTPWIEKLIPTGSEAARAAPVEAPPATAPAPAVASAAELPDWLKGAGPIAEEAAPVQSEPAAELPDWLTGMEAAAGLPEVPGETEAVTSGPEAELPDWLSASGATTVPETLDMWSENEIPPAEPTPFQEGSAELPDWLLKGEAIPEEELSAEPAPFQEGSAELPDWLLKGEAIPEEELSAEPAPTQEESAELPDWLLKGEAFPEKKPSAEFTWEGEGGALAEAERAPAQEESAELPDWLLKGEALPEEEPSAEPTWEEAAPAEAEPASQLPDWLLEVRAASPEAGSEASVAEPSAPAHAESAFPDWLLEAAPLETEPVPSEAEPAAVEPAAGLPDWLLEAAPLETEPVPSEAEPAAVEPAAGLPDWLLEAAPAEAEPVPPEVEPAAVEPAAGLPDWLMDVTPVEAVPAEAEPALAEPVAAAEPATELPDWLLDAASLDEAITLTASELEEAAPVEAAPASELPAWLFEAQEPTIGIAGEELQAEQPAAEETGAAESIAAESRPVIPAGELPDWLSEAAFIEEEAAPAEAESPAEKPAWLFETEEPVSTQEPAPEPAGEVQAFEPQAAGPVDTGLLDWLIESAPVEAEPAPFESEQKVEPATEIPDWLFETQEPASSGTGVEPAQEFDAGLPDWLRESAPAAEDAASLAAEPAEEIPAWLFETAGTKPESGEPPSSMVNESQLGDTQPLRLKRTKPPEAAGEPEAISADKLELDDAFAWLMGLGAAAEIAQPTQEEPVAEAASAIPETPFIEEQPTPEATVEPVSEELPVEEPLIAELPVEQAALEFETPIEPVSVELPAEEPSVEELPAEQAPPEPAASEAAMDADTAFAWLESLAVKQGANEALILKPEERLETMPDWVLQDTLAAEQAATETPEAAAPELEMPEAAEAVPAPELAAEQPAEVEQVEPPAPEPAELEPTGVEPVIDEDSAFAWLESLAVKQGANEALILKPEDRLETMPDWVRQDMLTAEQEAPEAPPTEPEILEAEAEEVLPVAELETEPIAEVEPVSEAPVAVEELTVVEALPVVEEQVSPVETPLEEVSLAEEAPEMADTGITEAETPPEAAGLIPAEAEAFPYEKGTGGLPALPDWLKESAVSPREEMEWTPPPVPHRRYDLNLASLSELERLPGVGFIAAQQITAYRDAHGPFDHVDDLANVTGIGPAMLAGIRDYLFVVEVERTAPEPDETIFLPAEMGTAPELVEARAQLTGGEMAQALEKYAGLIRTSSNLEKVIQDLQAAAYRFPTDINVWQYLGDACLRADRVQDALQAFIKAEQLLN